MENKAEFLEKLLGITSDWEVKEVKIDKPVGEIDIFIEYKRKDGICPFTKQRFKIYSLQEMRRWRHLDIMQYKTYINCRIPRVINEEGKISIIEVPWSDCSSKYTNLFEDAIIEVLLMCKNQTKTASYFEVSYDIVSSIIRHAIERGLDGVRLWKHLLGLE